MVQGRMARFHASVDGTDARCPRSNRVEWRPSEGLQYARLTRLLAVHPLSLARHNERVMESLLLKADDLWEIQAGQELNVEDLFDGSLEFEEGAGFAAAQVKHGDAALELVTALGDFDAVHGRSLADFREPDEGVGADQDQ